MRGTVRYRARWLFPGRGGPIRNGTIEVADGLVVAVRAEAKESAVDLGNCALVPGLVNAHTHLEFSLLSGPLGPLADFPGWIRQVVQDRRVRNRPVSDSIAAGLKESVRCGTTSLGEIATHDGLTAYSGAGCGPSHFTRDVPRVVVFRELLGLSEDAAQRQLTIAREHLSRPVSPGVRLGLSPHAPYSVHPRLLDGLVDLAAERHVPLAMHLAESQAEMELLRSGTGPLVEMLREFGVWRAGLLPCGVRTLDYLQRLARAPRVLVVHGNYFDDDEITFIARHPHMSVIYCPRTHAAMGHPPHPWQTMLNCGVNVAIGTDSRASNPDLSLFEELRFLKANCPEIPSARLLELGTWAGARALGIEDQVGSLQPGKAANLVAVSLGKSPTDAGPESLFSPEAKVAGVMLKGEWVGGPKLPPLS